MGLICSATVRFVLFKGILNGISLGTHARGLWRFPKGSHCRWVAQAPNPVPGRRLQNLTRVNELDPHSWTLGDGTTA